MSSPLLDDTDGYQSSDDDEIIEEHIDNFLINVESKLKSNFTSLELCRTILTGSSLLSVAPFSSMGSKSSKNNASPKRNLKLILKAFDQMAKPIKLRVLIALVCLDTYSPGIQKSTATYNKVQSCIWDILDKAENDKDQWVSILAGIVKGEIFYSMTDNGSASGASEEKNEISSEQSKKELLISSCRGEKSEKLWKRCCSTILKDLQKHAAQVNDHAVDLENENDDNEDVQYNRATADQAPLFVPLRYTLLSSKGDLSSSSNRNGDEENDGKYTSIFLPKSFEHNHFVANMDADILAIDEREDEARTLEEQKEIEKKETLRKEREMRKQAQSATTSTMKPLGRSSINNKTSLGRSGFTGGRTGRMGGEMMAKGRGLGRGRMAGMMSGLGRGRIGTSNSSSFMRAPQRLKTGRGSLGRTNLVSGSRNLNSLSSGNQTSMGSSGKAGGRATKMKMIDVNEVQNLEKKRTEKEKEDIENEREAKRRKIKERSGISKRKLLNSAKAKVNQKSNSDTKEPQNHDINNNNGNIGDMNNIGINNQLTHGSMNPTNITHLQNAIMENQMSSSIVPQPDQINQINQIHQQFQMEPQYQNNNLFTPDNSIMMNQMGQQADLSSFMATMDSSADILNPYNSFDHNNNGHQNIANNNNNFDGFTGDWRQLLEKSNKISVEDMNRVELFFTTRQNPTPGIMQYRLKLHEEKLPTPEGGLMKETLYLELDYKTFNVRKLKKNKVY